MGFDTENMSSRKSVQYVSIGSKQNESKVTINRYFQIVEKNQSTGVYEKRPMLNEKGYPLPFFGYLTEIKLDLENTFKQQGKEFKLPKIYFSFVDDENKNYVLDSPFASDNGRVNPNIMTMLNSLASIEKFGYLKLYITKTERTDASGSFNFTLNVRNAVDWNPELPKNQNYLRFLTPQDKTKVDETKVKWKYEYKSIPPIEIEVDIQGKLKKVDNTEEHQQFFIDIVNEINEKLKNTTYKTTEAKQVETPVQSTPKVATAVAQTPVVSNNQVDDEDYSDNEDIGDDLPF